MGEVQSETSKIEKKKEKKKKKTENDTLGLLKIIKKQQDQMSGLQAQIVKTSEDIDTLKEAHNKMVDVLTDIGKTIEKGGSKGGLGEIAVLLKAVAPFMKDERSSPFEAIGVYTFKQFLRTQFGKKAMKEFAKAEKETKKKGKEEEEE